MEVAVNLFVWYLLFYYDFFLVLTLIIILLFPLFGCGLTLFIQRHPTSCLCYKCESL